MTTSTSSSADGLWHHLRLVPELAVLDQPLADGDAACIVVQDGAVQWTGPESSVPAAYARLPRHDGRGALVTPGLVDCHTHLVYGGQRANEFAMRLAGATYEEVAQAGGGIVSSVKATRAASEDELFAQAALRLQALLAEGVCAIEIKSGYGLALAHERKQLRVARRLGEVFGVTVRTTFLGAHALPPEYAGRSQDYIDLVCNDMLPALAAEGLVDAVDAFCEYLAFSPAQVERVFIAAQALGLPVKLHAEQLSSLHGSSLAARYHALSADHLEFMTEDDAIAMAQSGTVAVLLPGAFYFLRETQLPPMEALRKHGVKIAVASDLNPGTSPALSVRLMLNMACTCFRMTPEEALAGVTLHAATALGMEQTHGSLEVGKVADFVAWQIDRPADLAYWLGGDLEKRVVRHGVEVTV